MPRPRPTIRLGLLGVPLILFVALPPAALILRGHSAFLSSLSLPDSISAIEVSLRTTCLSLVLLIALGTPLAAVLARTRSLAGRLSEVVLDLPLVLPPAAAGIGLLLAFGRRGMIPTGLPFTAGAVVAAQVFVSTPLYVRAATSAFRSVSGDLLDMAATEGAGPAARFSKILVPLTAPTLLSGAAMGWSRSLGEFGATILFAGSLVGRTQTLPLAIYLGFETDLDQAIGLSLLLLLIAGVVLIAARTTMGYVREQFD